MFQRVFSPGFRVSLAAIAVFLVASAPAQRSSAEPSAVGQPAAGASLIFLPAVSTPATTASAVPGPIGGTAEVDDLLRQGYRLEGTGRWGEALTHYEGALRQFPDDASLQRRFDFARQHYDVANRYSDRSFLKAVAELPAGKALDLYSQVAMKVEAHYVDAPNWKQLVERGTSDLEVALTEPAFLARNLPAANRPAVDEFRRQLRAQLGPRVISTREDARGAVGLAAQLAQSRLGIAPAAVVLEYLCGAANSLDPYSAYLTPDQLSEVYAQIEGNFVGLGIELKGGDKGLLIVRVISGSPAQQAGVHNGDQILTVDGRSTQELSTDQAANLLQGEADSVAALTVLGPDQQPRELRIRRERVEVPSIDDVKMLDAADGIGYFRLTCFQKTTSRDMDAAMWNLYREGMKSLVIDLRGNPGGLLVTAVEVVDKFVDRGIIVSTRGRSTQEDFTYSAHAAGTWRVPLVVLIDQDSASAAEIFAGAIRDHHRGTIVGVRSFGKGSVQGIFPLDLANAGIRLTTAKFYSPTGRPYAHVGVDPDILVRQVSKPIDGRTPASDGSDDAMLAAALQAAHNLGQTQQARNF